MIKIERKKLKNLDIVIIKNNSFKKYYLTAYPNENGELIFKNTLEYIKNEGATILSQFIFGNKINYTKSMTELNSLGNNITWPITWLQGDTCKKCACLTGTQLVAISGVDVKPIVLNGERLGSLYEDEDAQYCILENIYIEKTHKSNFHNVGLAYQKIYDALQSVGMDFSKVIRMWNYLDKILTWYDDFNIMRNDFFEKHHIFSHIVPAATGIGASNLAESAYTGSVFAVKPKKTSVKIYPVASPLQCPAIDYKSSFSRAVQLDLNGYSHLFISGTASIEENGETVHLSDVYKQVKLTMKVVEAILESRNMSWNNTVRAIAYFKDIKNAYLLKNYFEHNPHIPVVISHAEICRDNLLFEIELEAVSLRKIH